MKKKECEHKQTFLRRKDGVPVFRVCADCRAELPIIEKKSRKKFDFKYDNNDKEV